MCFGMECLATARLQWLHLRISGLSCMGWLVGKALDTLGGTLLMGCGCGDADFDGLAPIPVEETSVSVYSLGLSCVVEVEWEDTIRNI